MANSLRSCGIEAREDWEQAALDALRIEWGDAGFRNKSEQMVQRALYSHFLRSDLCESLDSNLPRRLLEGGCAKLRGSFVLQVNELLNVGETAEHRRRDSAQRCLKLHMTDGKVSVFGLEVRYLQDLSVHSRPGVKILVRNPSHRHGVLLLHPGNTVVLGGMVKSLQKFQDAAHEAGKVIHDAHLDRAMRATSSASVQVVSGGEGGAEREASTSTVAAQAPKRAKLHRQASGCSSSETRTATNSRDAKQTVTDEDVEDYLLQQAAMQCEMEEEMLRQADMSAAEKPREHEPRNAEHQAKVPEALEDDLFLEDEELLRQIDAQVEKATSAQGAAPTKSRQSDQVRAAPASRKSPTRKRKSPKRKRTTSPKRAADEAGDGMKQMTLSQTFGRMGSRPKPAGECKMPAPPPPLPRVRAAPPRQDSLGSLFGAQAPTRTDLGDMLLCDWLGESRPGEETLVVHGALVALKGNIRSKKKIGLFAEAEITDGSRSVLCLLPNATCEKLLGMKAPEMRAMAKEDPGRASQEAQKFAERAVKMHGILTLRKRAPDRISSAAVSLESFREPGEQDAKRLIHSLRYRYRNMGDDAVR
mmetsp:Transcript_1787/g.7797  ORF Transcript_1787/g.7797 Transcript_1787/m.7797 type:complete len:587 (-) Transcript_1787:73-1833(-)